MRGTHGTLAWLPSPYFLQDHVARSGTEDLNSLLLPELCRVPLWEAYRTSIPASSIGTDDCNWLMVLRADGGETFISFKWRH